MDDFEKILEFKPSVKQWEALLGISRQAIQDHRKNSNFIVEGESLSAGLFSAFDYMRNTAAGRIKTEGNEALIAAKTRQTEINADRQALALAKEAGLLVAVADFIDTLTNAVIKFRMRLQNEVPVKIVEKIELLYSIKVDKQVIQGIINPALDSISDDVAFIAKKLLGSDDGSI